MRKEDQTKASPVRSSSAISHRRKQLSWPEGHEFRILSIDGGGIKGIFPAAFMSGLEERYLKGDSIARHFDLIAGTSTGGIIALGLGAGLTAAELLDLYIHRGREIFPPRSPMIEPLAKLLQLVKFRYNRAALMNVLSDSFGDRKFGESNARLCIPSCDGRHSEVYIFKTPHHPDYHLDGTEKMAKVAAATSAAPAFFRPLDDGGYTFIDGGIWGNNPIMVGLVDVLACFSVMPDRIRILSLGCGESTYKVGKTKKSLGGLLSWLDIVFAAMRFQSIGAQGQAGLLIGADRILRVDPPPMGRQIQLDDWRRASGELPSAASEALKQHGNSVASLFLQEPATPYVPYSLDRANDNRPGLNPGNGDYSK